MFTVKYLKYSVLIHPPGSISYKLQRKVFSCTTVGFGGISSAQAFTTQYLAAAKEMKQSCQVIPRKSQDTYF
jgi:hypothetical protein